MKKILAVVLMLFAVNVFSAHLVQNSGERVDKFTVVDPGNVSGYDGYEFYYLFRENDVLVDIPITHETYSENFLCWGYDAFETDCPGDSDGQGGTVSPLIYYVETELFANNFIQTGDPLAVADEKMFYVAYWYELYVKPALGYSLADEGIDSLNATQKSRIVKYLYYSLGIDIVSSEIAANQYVNTGVPVPYTEVGLTNIPLQCQVFIYKVDEFGYLYVGTGSEVWTGN